METAPIEHDIVDLFRPGPFGNCLPIMFGSRASGSGLILSEHVFCVDAAAINVFPESSSTT